MCGLNIARGAIEVDPIRSPLAHAEDVSQEDEASILDSGSFTEVPKISCSLHCPRHILKRKKPQV